MDAIRLKRGTKVDGTHREGGAVLVIGDTVSAETARHLVSLGLAEPAPMPSKSRRAAPANDSTDAES